MNIAVPCCKINSRYSNAMNAVTYRNRKTKVQTLWSLTELLLDVQERLQHCWCVERTLWFVCRRAAHPEFVHAARRRNVRLRRR